MTQFSREKIADLFCGAGGTSTGAAKAGDDTWQPSFTPEQANFLWNKVRELAMLLTVPGRVHERAINHPRFASQVIDALNFTNPGPLIEWDSATTNICRWRYNRAGLAYSAAPTPKAIAAVEAPEITAREPGKIAAPEAAENADVGLIEKFNDELQKLTEQKVNCGTLGASLGVISTSPAWPSVEPALERLPTISGEYPEKPNDISIVGQFAQLLRRCAATIGISVYCGSVIGKWRANKEENRVFGGLKVLSMALRLKELHEEQVVQIINGFGAELMRWLNPDKAADDFARVSVISLTDKASVKEWREVVEELIKQSEQSALMKRAVDASMQSKAWEYWRQRLQGNLLIMGVNPPDFVETVICAAADAGLFQRHLDTPLLSFALEAMTARAWSAAFYATVRAASTLAAPPVVESIPNWLAIAALQKLGFSVEIPSLDPKVAPWRWKIPRLSTDARNTVLIVSKRQGESERWKPAKECAALVLRAEELMELLASQDQEALLRWLGLDWLVFDWSVPLAVSKRGSRQRPEDQPIYTGEEVKTAHELINFFSGPAFPIAIVPKEWQRTKALDVASDLIPPR